MKQIKKTIYKDIDAIALENDRLSAVFLPAYGGKMASLVDKKTGREFLVQADGVAYKKLDYAGSYIDAECSGFDDMFPTIDTWIYKKYPWQGTQMPDHGEVCGLPWEYAISEDGECLHCWAYGVRFAYRLDKWIRFEDENTLDIKYKAENLTPFDLDFIWAAHVMINAEPGARILLPYKNGAAATCVFSKDDDFAVPGAKMHWPETMTKVGSAYDISTTQPKDPDGNTYKYYFDVPMPDGWCGYAYKGGTTLMLKVSDMVPYLGVWVNDGAFKDYYNIALEPCTGTFDDPGRALEHGQSSVLPGNGRCDWQLQFVVR